MDEVNSNDGEESNDSADSGLERASTRDKNDIELIMAQSSIWSGPVPSPEVLKEFHTLDSGFPDRLITLAEEEQSHRHNRETTLLRNSYRTNMTGQLTGLVLGAGAIIAICWLAVKSHPGVAGTAIVTIGVVISWLYGKANKPSDDD